MKILKAMKNERLLCFCAMRFTAVAAVLYIFTPTHSLTFFIWFFPVVL